MSLNLDNLFGVHSQALQVRGQRMQIIASNLANADTPNYLARDIDFREALTNQRNAPLRTHPRHMTGVGEVNGAQLKYRVPLQPAVDGNTVDTQFEQSAYADNAVRFQASLTFLTGRIRGISDAITGGLR